MQKIRKVLLTIVLMGLPIVTFAKNNSSISPRRTVFVLLDGVSWRMAKELKDGEKLPGFGEPSKVISAFPSTTIPGVTGLLKAIGAEKTNGYENIYYSYKENKIIGSVLSAADKSTANYEDYFAFYRKTFWENLMIYLAPGMATQNDLIRIHKILLKSPLKKNVLFYLGGLDGAAHILGENRQKRMALYAFQKFNLYKREYEKKYGQSFNIVFFSDHGFSYSRLKGISVHRLKKQLARKGFILARSLADPRFVVDTEWGNIGGAAFYTFPKRTREVAEVLRGMRGNDLTFFPEKGSIVVLSAARGEARIDADSRHRHFRYREITGDPLDYHDVVRGLRTQHKLDARGFAKSKDWFAATHEHHYPDVPFRIHEAFYGLVKNPATILISTKENYGYGSPLTRNAAKFHGGLKGTHGGITDSVSDAFVITDRPRWKLPPVMRYTDVFRYIKFRTIRI